MNIIKLTIACSPVALALVAWSIVWRTMKREGKEYFEEQKRLKKEIEALSA